LRHQQEEKTGREAVLIKPSNDAEYERVDAAEHRVRLPEPAILVLPPVWGWRDALLHERTF
jgi:hypothetical protein